MTDLDRLDVLAAAASGDVWYPVAELEPWVGKPDAAFIAACDPATIRSLVAEVRRGREAELFLGDIQADLKALGSPLARDMAAKIARFRAALHREDGA